MISAGRFEAFCDTGRRTLDRPTGAALALSLYILTVLSYNFPADNDLFARVAMGRLVSTRGAVPLQDPFAFTPKNEFWIDHEWLSGLVFYFLSQHGGDLALFIFKAVVCLISTGLILWASFLASGKKSPGVFWMFLLVTANAYLWASTVRSQVFTYLFLPVSLLAFVSAERGRGGWLWILPLIMAVWANCHGGFVVGLGFHVIFAAAALARGVGSARAAILTCVLSFLATLINPYGPVRYWEYILHAAMMDRPDITEWARTPLLSADSVIPNLFVICLALGIYRKWGSEPGAGRGRHWLAGVFILLSLYYGYRHLRLMGIFTIVACVVGRPYLDAGFGLIEEKIGRWAVMVRRVCAAALVCCVPLMVLFIGTRLNLRNFSLDYSSFPVTAADWLYHERSGGNVLVDFNYGSFALWRLYPKYRISIDGRYEEVYPNETLRLVDLALRPEREGHAAAMKALSPDYILLSAKHYKPGRLKKFGADWSLIYQDPAYLVLGKQSNHHEDSPRPSGAGRPMWECGF